MPIKQTKNLKRKTRKVVEPVVVVAPQKSFAEKAFPYLMGVIVVMLLSQMFMWNKVNGNTSPTQKAGTTVKLSDIKGLFKKDVLKFGDASKKVLFVDIGDPSCPFCHVAAGQNPELNVQINPSFKLSTDGGSYVAPVPEMRKLVEAGKAGMVMIYTPGHGNGEMGMMAMYCAQDMGRFWQAHDLLYTKAGYALLNDVVKNERAKSGVLAEFLKPAADSDQMQKCLDSGKYNGRLTSDIQLASSLGVSGTPGFFVNEKLFAGAYAWKDMEPDVTAALNKKGWGWW